MAWLQVCRASCNRNCLTCKRSALRWKAYGECKWSKKAQLSGTFGRGEHCLALHQPCRVLTTCPCRKVEQVSEETDALRVALDKHTGRQNRCVAAHQEASGIHLLEVCSPNKGKFQMWHMTHKLCIMQETSGGTAETRAIAQIQWGHRLCSTKRC